MRAISGVDRIGKVAVIAALGALACGPAPEQPSPRTTQQPTAAPLPPPIPDETGWGVHALVARRSPAGHLWVGTYDRGIFRLPQGQREWEHVAAAGDAETTIGPAPINSLAFQGDDIIWYGSAGGGFGVSSDGGRTWQNWGGRALGPQWQYVAQNGIRTRGDTVFIATSDGVRITWDGGASWRCAQGVQPAGAAPPASQDACAERVATLPNGYVLSLALDPRGAIWAGHLGGLAVSRDAGRTWQQAQAGDPPERVRAVAVGADSIVWAASEQAVFVDSAGTGMLQPYQLRLTGWPGLPGAVREIVPGPGTVGPAFATSFGLAASDAERRYRMYYLAAAEQYRPAADIWHMVWWGPPLWPIGASGTGLNTILAGETRFAAPPRATIAATAAPPLRPWLGRPIEDATGNNPRVDPTTPFGTVGALDGRPWRGAAFHNPPGTPVRAIAAGRVVFAGQAADGSNAIAIVHDRRAGDGSAVYSVYLHNRSIAVTLGQQIAAGAVIAEVGRTGATRSSRLQLRLHVAPDDVAGVIVNTSDGAPPYAVNPQLWLEPLPGTGVVTGRVLDAAGQPVRGAHVFGLVLDYPDETPFSYAVTYGENVTSDPDYGEHFVVGDVPAGDYTVGVEIAGRRLWRRVTVAPGMVTTVEFRP